MAAARSSHPMEREQPEQPEPEWRRIRTEGSRKTDNGPPTWRSVVAAFAFLLPLGAGLWQETGLVAERTAAGAARARGAAPPRQLTAEEAAPWQAPVDAPWEAPAAALQDHEFLLGRLSEEHGWVRSRAEAAVVEYLRFLQLLAEAPAMELVASSAVDLVWHEHLVDTRNYAADTGRLYGRYLHHRRARTTGEVAGIPAAYAHTKARYTKRFGAAPPPDLWGDGTDASSMCGGGGLDPSNVGPVSAGNGSSTSAPMTPELSGAPPPRARVSCMLATALALASSAWAR